MNLVVKGAVAATGAAVLMVGGVGSLAYWTDSKTVTNTSITSGELKLGTPACGSGWMLDGTTPVAFTSSMRLVPGDVLTKTCSIDLIASGDHLGATLALSTPTWAATTGLTGELTHTEVFKVNGATKTSITPADALANTTDEIKVTVTVTFNGDGATNASQGLSAALGDMTFTATQNHHA